MINQMDATAAKYIRARERGQATDSSESHPLCRPRAVLRRRWEAAPARCARASRRLAWVKKMARDPESHAR
eukprot:6582673-Pyramimonas_sp.AAC.1